jgi:hypothetical protein
LYCLTAHHANDCLAPEVVSRDLLESPRSETIKSNRETGYALSIELRTEVAFLAMDAFQKSLRSGGAAEIKPM